MIADDPLPIDTGPLVSIVLTVFNRQRYLDEAIRSALAQSYPRIQIIVVDDGSEGDIFSVVAPYADRVEFHRQENAGMAAARNLGMRHVRGEFVLFLDDDDFLEHDAVEVLLRAIGREGGLAWAAGRFRYVDDSGRKEPGRSFLQEGISDVYREMIERCCISCPSSVLLRLAVLRGLGGFDQRIRLSEDYDLWLRLARNYPLAFTEAFVTNYRIHPGQNSRTGWERHYEAHLRVLIDHRKRARTGTDRSFREAIASVCSQYADSLDYQNQPRAARIFWRRSLAERGDSADPRIARRILKSYLPSAARRSLRDALATLRGRAAAWLG